MRLIGVGRAGMSLFCTLMDLPTPLTQGAFDHCNDAIRTAAKEVSEESMYRAAQEEKEKTDPKDGKIIVSGDGSWRKRGYSSLTGLQYIIGNKTKKVIDVNVKSAYCQECVSMEKYVGTPQYLDWIDPHIEKCQANYEGSAGGMEPVGILEMFKRSKEKYGVVYSGMQDYL